MTLEDGITDLEGAIRKLLKIERLVLEPARQLSFDFEAFKKVWQAFENTRT